MALVELNGVPSAGFSQHVLDAQVDEMIRWADLDKDGMISFEEYEWVIQAGCAPDGGRIKPPSKPRKKEPELMPREPPITAHDSDGSVIHL